MGKRILAVVVGLIVGMGIIMTTEMISGNMYAPPPGTDFNNPESVKAMVAQMPIGAHLMILLSYVLGSFGGGLSASLIAGIRKPNAALIVGSVLLIAGVMNVVMVPGHPLWFIVASFISFHAFAYLGYLSVRNRLTILP